MRGQGTFRMRRASCSWVRPHTILRKPPLPPAARIECSIDKSYSLAYGIFFPLSALCEPEIVFAPTRVPSVAHDARPLSSVFTLARRQSEADSAPVPADGIALAS